jgi:hypothetical protein
MANCYPALRDEPPDSWSAYRTDDENPVAADLRLDVHWCRPAPNLPVFGNQNARQALAM